MAKAAGWASPGALAARLMALGRSSFEDGRLGVLTPEDRASGYRPGLWEPAVDEREAADTNQVLTHFMVEPFLGHEPFRLRSGTSANTNPGLSAGCFADR
jgi:hypothetical protein